MEHKLNGAASTLIRNAWVVNEGQVQELDVLVEHGKIARLGLNLNASADHVVQAHGRYLLPGLIDDQVHFREPGLTHKGEIATESRAAVAGGVTSYMEMPNTKPPAFTHELLEAKYQRAAQVSPANYSFYLGASDNNLEAVKSIDLEWVCGLKIFMGSSTGDLLVDDPVVLDNLFRESPVLIATHCEDEQTIRNNLQAAIDRHGEDIALHLHPHIRSHEACRLSTELALELARKHNTRLHILHISTAQEAQLFDNSLPLEQKRITAEACLHHLWFTQEDYHTQGSRIKWNPAVKTAADRDAIWEALLNDRIDVLATDHAPHTLAEKQHSYTQAPSGGPLVQHWLPGLLDCVHQGRLSLPQLVQKACHNVAIAYQLAERGFVREGYWADLTLVDLGGATPVTRDSLLYKCGWSPFEGQVLRGRVEKTWVNGALAYAEGRVNEQVRGQRLRFAR